MIFLAAFFMKSSPENAGSWPARYSLMRDATPARSWRKKAASTIDIVSLD
jgi:hypothetical protein